jgi:predicted RNase H-like nuclease
MAVVRVLGIDGWKAGWVAVVLEDGRFQEAIVAPALAALIEAWPDAACYAVDIPIGLVTEGKREADEAARTFLGARRSTVFPTPPRPALDASTYPEALATSRAFGGPGLSKQAYNLFPRIREADAFADDRRVVEVHPEVSFAVLSGAPVSMPKKTWAGQAVRRDLLDSAGIVLAGDLGAAGRVPPDDVLDAAVAAWSAHRVAAGRARSFPEAPAQTDRSGRLIAIRA